MSGPTTGMIQEIDTPLRAMKITNLPVYAFATTYQIEVAAYYAGFLQPFTPSTCAVTTPTVTTSLIDCDLDLTLIGDIIYAGLVDFANGYQFKIIDPVSPANTQEIIRPLREFRMTDVTAFEVLRGKTYIVQVAVRNTDGSFLPYGPFCQVSTPPFPTTSIVELQCDDGTGFPYEVPSMNTQIFANSYPGAIAYVFRLTGVGLPVSGIEVEKPLRVFTLNDFAGMGLNPGQAYNINVRMIFNEDEPPGSYGKTCSLRVPGGARLAAPEFTAVAHPNPFAESFAIEIKSPIKGSISIRTYDMTGRLLETQTLDTASGSSIELGERYPAGVYNVIVTQGETVKTLRVIKR